MKQLFFSLALAVLPATVLAQPTAHLPSTEALLQMAGEFEQELTGNILPYWIKQAPNPETGGFYGQVSADGKPDPSAERGALLSSRILWSYSAAYRNYRDEAYRKLADHAFKDLEATFWDNKNGGLYWSVAGDGKPAQTHKQIYGQVFGIYGYSEYFRATGNQQALERAKTLYRLIEQYALDREYGGYLEVVGEDWRPLAKPVNSLGVTTAKSQNTHLHVMEAYTNLLRVWPDGQLKKQQTALLDIMLGKILNRTTNHLALFMDADWQVQGDGISYGHDIEAAWLMVEAAEVLGDADLINRTRALAVKIADTTLAEGMDTDGAIYNEASARKGLTNTGKDWWAQAEALVGFINAYEITGDTKYLRATTRTWGFIKAHLVNNKTGEWHWGTNKSGQVILQPTLSMWKCPYHNSRAMMESARRLQRLATLAKH
ncbi:AGE family epimerase/isomerase [Cellvibrio fibrivorans]|uniref:Cellobiose 2-epimerase n=1 Tax=Cellvibrio fibrivorans TaxID=126350 RepID=A0ABU1UXU1_9GAMM|nr:AGE family epimerase/isomerase [Cellvibrio fibrivorans]MDR7089963.1 mannobiose 2-epimerase [Cellvibrio fibrivorans]